MARLKVFVVPAGFHDAYVAAPSRKAALAAWGSDHDLFARGIAREVTDPTLTAEPLAQPGTVIKRSRGTSAEQIAALTDGPVPDAASKKKRATAPAKASPPPKPPPPPRPKPTRDALGVAEQALADVEAAYRETDATLRARQKALDRERRDLDAALERDRVACREAIAAERDRYDRAMSRWRKG